MPANRSCCHRPGTRKAFALLEACRPQEVRLKHAFQTNGTLLDDRWIPVLARPDVRVGISVDGPPALHDLRRRARDGRGTFERTIRGLRLLRAAQVPFHVLTVLGLESLRCADDLIDFYLAEGVERVCFNVEEIEGVNRGSSLCAPDVEARLRRFLHRVIERLAALERPLWIREISAALGSLTAPPDAYLRNPQAEPLAIVSIDADGNLSTFSPELLGAAGREFAGFRFGGLPDGGPAAVLRNADYLRARAAIVAGIEACRARCPWFRWCGGGAPANKYFETGTFAATETLHCRLTKQVLLDVVLEAVDRGAIPALMRAA
jgi:uncharacterized protein